MDFEWDPAKNRSNRAKHGIGFPEAIRVFLNPYVRGVFVSWADDEEDRWAAIGLVGQDLLSVCYTDRDDGIRRIISARRASRNERRRYDQGYDPVR